MKIGIDIRSAIGNKSGIGYYTMSLVTHLSKVDHINTYYLYTSQKVDWELSDNFIQIVRLENGILNKFLWMFKLFKECLIGKQVDVFFSPNSLTIATLSLFRRNVVLTVHDLVPVLMRGTTNHNVRFFFIQLPIALKLSRAILVPSIATKKDLLRLYKIPENKVFLTPEAAHDWCFGKTTEEEIKRVKSKYNLPENYFLFVSTLEPRKNIPNLVRAFSKFSKKDTQNFKLVIGGKKGWMYDEIFAVVEEEKLKNKVIFTDYIPDEDLLPLYKGAVAFTFVPFMEGFGLTPLEAMATGTPVLTSNCSSLPEVVNDAALLVNPNDVIGIAGMMKRLAEDMNLRQQLINKGNKQVKNYSWKKTAELTLEVLELTNNKKL